MRHNDFDARHIHAACLSGDVQAIPRLFSVTGMESSPTLGEPDGVQYRPDLPETTAGVFTAR